MQFKGLPERKATRDSILMRIYQIISIFSTVLQKNPLCASVALVSIKKLIMNKDVPRLKYRYVSI